jgi:YebC/PmpR family DNA-binding regulatory protein
MSGHSKWATIRRKKEITDSRRGQLFTKLAREITVAAKEGGGSLDANFRLRIAVQRARSESMPADNIQRAIDRGAGAGEGSAAFEEIMYEGYGPHGSAIIVQTLTDNRNRTVGEIRSTFTRGGGSLGENGSVIWMFKAQGLLTVDSEGKPADDVELAAIDAGADDVKEGGEEGTIEVYVPATELKAAEQALTAQKLKVVNAERTMTPTTTVELGPKETEQVLKLVERLEELDDVQQVFTNLELTEAALAGMEG